MYISLCYKLIHVIEIVIKKIKKQHSEKQNFKRNKI